VDHENEMDGGQVSRNALPWPAPHCGVLPVPLRGEGSGDDDHHS
jgi:hypothetical protein